MADGSDESAYAIVKQIPKCFRSHDLRNFFSYFIEKKSFECFHYRHRPEKQKTKHNDSQLLPACVGESQKTSVTKTFCCVIKLKQSNVEELLKLYNNKYWIDQNGDALKLKCAIAKFDPDNDISTLNAKAETINNIIELKPPSIMPLGNVGTPVSVFLELIRACQLPPVIIRKLKLVFPMTRGRRIYSTVPYDYGGPIVPSTSEEETVLTASGHELSDKYIPSAPKLQETHDDVSTESDQDSSDCEDWERHESLHDDVTQQERTKERLFEEEIELQWEKGGSGLVFYTDAQYWDEKEGDFDAKTADDWDIDMSGYYEKDGGDKDARDFLQMEREQALRNGMDVAFPQCSQQRPSKHKFHYPPQHSSVNKVSSRLGKPMNKIKKSRNGKLKQYLIGLFEKHTKGVGRKIMEHYGWRDGDGLGHSNIGMAEALDNDGQHPRNKSGFGYHGEKLNRFSSKRPKASNLQ